MKRVVIVIEGGAVQSVIKPKDIEVEVRDYDLDGVDIPRENEMFKKDEDGDWFQLLLWEANSVE